MYKVYREIINDEIMTISISLITLDKRKLFALAKAMNLLKNIIIMF